MVRVKIAENGILEGKKVLKVLIKLQGIFRHRATLNGNQTIRGYQRAK